MHVREWLKLPLLEEVFGLKLVPCSLMPRLLQEERELLQAGFVVSMTHGIDETDAFISLIFNSLQKTKDNNEVIIDYAATIVW